jgi:hypothetical protein
LSNLKRSAFGATENSTGGSGVDGLRGSHTRCLGSRETHLLERAHLRGPVCVNVTRGMNPGR